MKICYISDLFPPYDKGGAERIAYYEANWMANKGHEISVISSSRENLNKSSKYRIEKRDGIKIYYFSPSINFNLNPYTDRLSNLKKAILLNLSLYNPHSHLTLRNILKQESPDIVHAHYIYYISYGALKAIDLNTTKLIITYHMYNYECPKGGLLKKGLIKENFEICKQPHLICKFRNKLFKKMTPEASLIIAISKFIKFRLEEMGYKNIVYLPNGVQITREKEENSIGKPEILYVGRLTKAKGVHLLIKAFNSLRPKGFSLRIIGDGEDRKYFEEQAKQNKNIIFMGKVTHEKVKDFYKRCYAVVVPSIWYEVMNTVICEAMANGKPVIASDMPGNKDMIEDGQTGILFPAGNINELIKSLKLLIEHKKLAEEMGKRGSEKIKEFSEEKHFDKLVKLYKTVIDVND